MNYGRRHGIRSTSTVKSEIIPDTEAEKCDNNSELINEKSDNNLHDLDGFESVKRKSKFWKYFLLNKKEEKVKCTICSSIMNFLEKNGTGTLHKHLKCKHLKEFQSLLKNEPQKKTKWMPDYDSFVKNLSEASKPIKQEGEIVSKLQSTSDEVKKLDDKSSFGFSFIRFGVDNIPNTTELIDAQGNINYDRITYFSAADLAFIGSYGKKVNDYLSVGYRHTFPRNCFLKALTYVRIRPLSKYGSKPAKL